MSQGTQANNEKFEVMHADLLHSWLKTRTSYDNRSFLVVDVRGDDYVGGHIRGCLHLPHKKFTAGLSEGRLLGLVPYDDIVFHCYLSQVRGPQAARSFAAQIKNDPRFSKTKIWLLEGGIEYWMKLYGEDTNTTEGLEKARWSGGHLTYF